MIPELLIAAAPALATFNPAPTESLGQVDWFTGPYYSARAKADAENRWIMLVFWADEYAWCEKLAKDTLSDAGILTKLDELICISVDLTRNASGRYRQPNVGKYVEAFPVQTFPTLIFVGPDGEREDLIAGYIPATDFLIELERITQGVGTLSALVAALEQNPKSIEARYALSGKLFDLGFLARSQEQRAIIDRQDPQKRSIPLRRESMSILQEKMFRDFASTERIDFAPLEEFLKSEEHPELLYEGWTYMSKLYEQFKEPKKARGARIKAWPYVPDDDRLDAGHTLVLGFWQARPELTRSERRFALDVARTTAQVAENLSNPTLNDQAARYSGPEYDEFLAVQLDLLACFYALNGKQNEAFEVLKRCQTLAPENQAYVNRVEELRSL